jgi:hypothetical protein
MVDAWTPIEENGFIVADFYKDRIDLAFYLWNGTSQSADDIQNIEPGHRVTLRPTA